MADPYKRRWAIELFFRYVKQTPQIRHFLGTGGNAVRIQIAVALCREMPLRSHATIAELWIKSWRDEREHNYGIRLRKAALNVTGPTVKHCIPSLFISMPCTPSSRHEGAHHAQRQLSTRSA